MNLRERLHHPVDLLLGVVPAEKRRLGAYMLLVLFFHLAVFELLEVPYPIEQSAPTGRERVSLWHTSAASSVASQPLATLMDPAFLLVPQPAAETTPQPINLNQILQSKNINTTPAPKPAIEPGQASLLAASNRSASESLTVQSLTASPLNAASDHLSHSPSTSPILSQSQALWEPPLLAREPQEPWMPPSPAIDTLPDAPATILRLAVSAEGKVVEALVDQSCGNATIDQMALQAVHTVRLKPAASPQNALLWGRVRILWSFRKPSRAPLPLP